MASKYGSLKLPALKEELRKRNAKLSGRKEELVERLDAYDRNQNFGQPDQLEPEYWMKLPDDASYSDVNSDSNFCGTDLDIINSYLHQFEKKLGPQIQQLYNEKFLRYFRTTVEHTDNGDQTYLKSSCHAEMKRSVCYSVDVLLSHRRSVVEAQCECAAGMGPTAHCKHVCAVLYASSMFSKKNYIKTEETCTQKLQTFHKCKPFIGSPLKVNSLDMAGADEFTNIDFDPRPEHRRNSISYQDHFRNTCLNFPGISQMPIFQTFEPANTFGVAHDHDYLELTPEDNFLAKMLVSNITTEQIMDIEERTIGQSMNNEWKEERTKRLPSSMFGRICKLTERTDKDKLAKSFTNVTNIKAAPLEHGQIYESIAIEQYSKDSGHIVKQCGLVVCKEFPFLAASPDGVIEKHSIVEVKCPYSSRDKLISPATVPYLKLNESKNYYLDENHNYYYQIQGQLLCTGAKTCTLIVCTANNLKVTDMKHFRVNRNDPFIAEMVRKLKEFFDNHFKDALLEKHFYKPYVA